MALARLPDVTCARRTKGFPYDFALDALRGAHHRAVRGHEYVRGMSADLKPRDAIELLLTAKNQADVHSGQVILTVEQVDQIIGALGGVG